MTFPYLAPLVTYIYPGEWRAAIAAHRLVAGSGGPVPSAAKSGRVRAALAASPQPARAEEVADLFGRRNKARVERVNELLEMLVLLGQAVAHGEGRYAAG